MTDEESWPASAVREGWGRLQGSTAEGFQTLGLPVEHVAVDGVGVVPLAPMWAVDLHGQRGHFGKRWIAPVVALGAACRGLTEAEARVLIDAAFSASDLSGPDAAEALARRFEEEREGAERTAYLLSLSA